jgi:hypothetical protein
MEAVEFVFGYGALSETATAPLTRTPDPRGYVTDLHGHRRCLGVAMDNRDTLDGYKHYLLGDGSRPAVYVAFLDIVSATGAINGVCLPVSAADLERLDDRERNYRRVEVTAQIAQPLGRTWAYAGSAAGRARLDAGRRTRTAVVSREYREIASHGFARLGDAELARLRASSALDELPILDLDRVDAAGQPSPRNAGL